MALETKRVPSWRGASSAKDPLEFLKRLISTPVEIADTVNNSRARIRFRVDANWPLSPVMSRISTVNRDRSTIQS